MFKPFRVMHILAVLFDLHHTLTDLKESLPSLFRKVSEEHGVDLSSFGDNELNDAFQTAEAWLQEHQVDENVAPSWGQLPEDWVQANRFLFETLGHENLSNSLLLQMENRWKHLTRDTDYEFFPDDSLHAVRELYQRGYKLGICTRRHDDPQGLISRSQLQDIFTVVKWTGVPGYAKPSAYSLLRASESLGVNPRLCAFVGNYVEADIKAAVRAEMLPVLLTWATPWEGKKAPEDAIVLESPLDLLEVF
ncbi:MAG: HAD family hydrolase [Candidatus Thorarchaeota archaeon]|jgi:HAD superfamily hydrolase (TIGR01549 family)